MTDREKYRQQMNAVSFSEDFRQRAIGLMKQAVQKKETAPMKNKKTVKIIIALAAAFVLLTGSVFAVSALLSAREVAQQMGDNAFITAFESEDAVSINQTITAGDYDFTLLGIAPGERIDLFDDLPVESPSSYVVLAVKRTDGTPIAPEDGILDRNGNENVSISPLVEGWAPHHVNAWSLSCAGHGITVDGVRYYLFDYANLELFADSTVYLAVYEGFAPSTDIFTMDESGAIDYAEGYEGIRAMFTLPIDPSRADREAAMQLLEEIGILDETGEPVDEEVYTVTEEIAEELGGDGVVIVTDEGGTFSVVMDENDSYAVVMDENGTVTVEGGAGELADDVYETIIEDAEEVTTSGEEQKFVTTTVVD